VIERHYDIGPQRFFNLNGSLRRDEMSGSIDMRLKTHPFVCHLAQLRETENLKPPTVRQDGSRPPGKPMQPTHLSYNLMPRPQIEVVRIIQHETKAELL
jgi:hypothetical protein